MTKKELFILLQLVTQYYEQFTLDQNKIDAWYIVLREEDFENMKKKLLSYVSQSVFPPKISDLLKNACSESRIVPDIKETSMLLQASVKVASTEVVQQELAKMREILGIRREV